MNLENHKCNCIGLLQELLSKPLKFPQVNKFTSGYIIVDPDLMEIDNSIEITIIGREATWKINTQEGTK